MAKPRPPKKNRQPAALTPDQIAKARDFAACAGSFEYFINGFCYIQDRRPGSDTGEQMRFKLWPGQAKILPLFLTCLYLIALKARQLGITWLAAAYVLWRAMFRFNEFILVVSENEDKAIEFLDRVKYIFDRLPSWMKPTVLKRATQELSFGIEERDDQGQLKIGGLNSTIKSSPSTPTAGQSRTISCLVLDESALNRYVKEIWASAKPTLEHSGGQVIVISNASKTAPGWGWTRDIYTGSMKGENDFRRLFMDWRAVPSRGDDFLDQQRRAGLDESDIEMQYPSTEEQAISSLGGSYFGDTIASFKPFAGSLGYLRASEETGKVGFYEETGRAGIIEVWRHPETVNLKYRYAIGSDVSEGLGESYSVAYVYDRRDDV